ncbi:MAG: DUF1599 domain-containing protein [Porphyromonas sp.]|nr:DUF1599 domain-containing protein [Porphyromonas sp.]
MAGKTEGQYDRIIAECRALYEAKFDDYGASWRVMRPSAITDQIFIKAQRIRTLQDKRETKVGECPRNEFIGIVNYGIMGLVQLEEGYTAEPEVDKMLMMGWYDKFSQQAKSLMVKKNHDYGEAWRSMRISSITDIIMQKVFRTKQIEDNSGATKVSEGIDANYMDMINYAIFALILIEEGHDMMV